MASSATRKCKQNHEQRQPAGGNGMDEVFRMYAMSDGDSFGKPGDLDHGQVDAFADEEDELETAGILTSSDDDEVVAEESGVVIAAVPHAKTPQKGAEEGKKAAKKAAKKAEKKAPAKKAAKKAAK